MGPQVKNSENGLWLTVQNIKNGILKILKITPKKQISKLQKLQ